MPPQSKARHAKRMQSDATGRKGSDRTAKPLFAGSIPARASLQHNDLRCLLHFREVVLGKSLGKEIEATGCTVASLCR
jgi:hypothetical protein